MSPLLQRVAREPVAVTGIVVALYGVLTVFDVLHLTTQQTGALGMLGGAIIAALRWLVTPSAEVLYKQPPGALVPEAGPASDLKTGTPVDINAIELDPAPTDTNLEDA